MNFCWLRKLNIVTGKSLIGRKPRVRTRNKTQTFRLLSKGVENCRRKKALLPITGIIKIRNIRLGVCPTSVLLWVLYVCPVLVRIGGSVGDGGGYGFKKGTLEGCCGWYKRKGKRWKEGYDAAQIDLSVAMVTERESRLPTKSIWGRWGVRFCLKSWLSLLLQEGEVNLDGLRAEVVRFLRD